MIEIVKLSSRDFLDKAEAPKPSGSPVGEITPLIQSRAVQTDKGRSGIWTASPGQFRRQILQAEYCIFLDGQCSFTPDNEETIQIRPGDALYFPENSHGVWDIVTECRKAFFIFN